MALKSYALAHAECGSIDGCASPQVQARLDGCTAEDVPILRMLYKPCPPGFHGYGCDTRWDLQDEFLPRPRRWLRQFNATTAAPVDCQRGFFNALAEVLTRMHWEQEWDAQPFRIAATPPRTMGKMLHQLVTANYFHLTEGPQRKRLRIDKGLPGSYMKPLPHPGFKWNILDYGGGGREEIDYKRLTTMPGNVFSRPLAQSKRCSTVRSAWHCLWQRFPGQRLQPSPVPHTVVGTGARYLYNLSYAGEMEDSLLQYLIVAGTVDVFTQPTSMVRAYVMDHLKVLCHRPGPYCGGGNDEQRTPIAAMHVRQGDSCDRRTDSPGPFNAMFAPNPKTGRLERTSFRYCYSWNVYKAALLKLRRLYGVRTVVLASDDHTGEVVRRLQKEVDYNWLYLDYPRDQFRKRAWMEFRSDLDEHSPFSLAAELELLSEADLFVGNMGSHTSRMLYMKLVAAAKTAVLPPFVSVDGYGMCCGFTDECTKPQIRARRRDIRGCIYTYGLATGGNQYF